MNNTKNRRKKLQALEEQHKVLTQLRDEDYDETAEHAQREWLALLIIACLMLMIGAVSGR